MKLTIKILVICIFLSGLQFLKAQERTRRIVKADSSLVDLSMDSVKTWPAINFNTFYRRTAGRNLQYAAQLYNINITDAYLIQAGISPDPVLSAGYYNNGQTRLATGLGFSAQISKTVELGGKRRARINLAISQAELQKASVADFFRQLRADAAINFLEGMRRQKTYLIQRTNYDYLRQLAIANQIQFELGIITEVDAIQARVEAEKSLNAVTQADADRVTAFLNLQLFTSSAGRDSLRLPLGNTNRFERNFSLEQLIIEAHNNRADLLAARKGQDVACKALQLAKANRMMDLDIAISNVFAGPIKNIIEPTPSYNTVGVNLAIPLKFSNSRNRDWQVASLQMQQADLQYKQIELNLEVEVRQAFEQYQAQSRQVKRFNSDLLGRAQRVLDGRIYAYRRGSASLLEVLAARQTFNDLQLSYNEVLINYASALVNLEKAVGIWDIDF